MYFPEKRQLFSQPELPGTDEARFKWKEFHTYDLFYFALMN